MKEESFEEYLERKMAEDGGSEKAASEILFNTSNKERQEIIEEYINKFIFRMMNDKFTVKEKQLMVIEQLQDLSRLVDSEFKSKKARYTIEEELHRGRS